MFNAQTMSKSSLTYYPSNLTAYSQRYSSSSFLSLKRWQNNNYKCNSQLIERGSTQKVAKDQFMYNHIEEIPGFDDDNFPHGLHLLAGALAGVSEHVCMFPFDTIKTRMQTFRTPSYSGVTDALTTIIKSESITGLYKGLSTVFLGAIPSHALYFATYEFVKHYLGPAIQKDQRPHAAITTAAGVSAIIIHDFISTPIDVIKQRMQLQMERNSTRVYDVVRSIVLKEGLRTFYLSFPTTLIMNIPYTTVHFFTYEFISHALKSYSGHHGHECDHEHDHNHHYIPWKHIVAGGMAGAAGAAISNPIDVIKTRLQTQGVFLDDQRFRGIRDVAQDILKTHGIRGFCHGIIPRMLYFTPSAAITWTTYEYIKYLFK